MEFEVDRNLFFEKVGLVSGVTAQRPNTLPILGNILLESRGGNQILLAGTDLEISLTTQLQVERLVEGQVTIPGRKLFEILRELPPGQIEVVVAKNNTIGLKAGKALFKVLGLGREDFPKLPEGDPTQALEVDQLALKECLSLTSFAISHDETRYVLNGVYLQLKDNTLCCVATDGRRLAFAKKSLETTPTTSLDMIIPTKAAQELEKVLGGSGKVRIHNTKNQAVFYLNDTILSTRLIEGHFPNYEQVIPKDEKTTAMVRREELLQALRRASLLTSADSQLVKIDFLKDHILISSRSPNLGEAREEVVAECRGPEVAIGFNPGYLLDVLKHLDTDTVSFSLTGPDKPGLIRGREDYLYVIMPMQLN